MTTIESARQRMAQLKASVNSGALSQTGLRSELSSLEQYLISLRAQGDFAAEAFPAEMLLRDLHAAMHELTLEKAPQKGVAPFFAASPAASAFDDDAIQLDADDEFDQVHPEYLVSDDSLSEHDDSFDEPEADTYASEATPTAVHAAVNAESDEATANDAVKTTAMESAHASGAEKLPEVVSETKQAVTDPRVRFERVRTLKETLFGHVVLARDREAPGKPLVAVKLSRRDELSRASHVEDPLHEAAVMRQLAQPDGSSGHPALLQLVGEFTCDRYHWTVLEFAGGGELFDLVAARGRLDNAQARSLFRALVGGVRHMHTHGLAHLDLSLENLLLTTDGHLKLCDFGVARACQPGQLQPRPGTARPGKTTYMAPEIYAGARFDAMQADAWSVGVILFIMLCGVPPYGLPTQTDPRYKFVSGGRLVRLLELWKLRASLDDLAVDLMLQLFAEPGKRPSFDEIERHPWMDSD